MCRTGFATPSATKPRPAQNATQDLTNVTDGVANPVRHKQRTLRTGLQTPSGTGTEFATPSETFLIVGIQS